MWGWLKSAWAAVKRFFRPAVRYAAKRLCERSTAAGAVAVVTGLLHVTLPTGADQLITNGVVVAAGLAAMLLPGGK